jgi:hypothetical protein
MVQERDVLLVNGGDSLYLCYRMRQSGLADLVPSLRDVVEVGLSADTWTTRNSKIEVTGLAKGKPYNAVLSAVVHRS